jgi:hypothetical protein
MTEEVEQPGLVTVRSGPTAFDEFGPDRRRFGLELSAAVERCLDEPTLTRAHRRIQRKALCVGAWYIGSYLLLLLAGSWWLGIVACTSLAVSMAGVGFNIQHDANHNALFRTVAPSVSVRPTGPSAGRCTRSALAPRSGSAGMCRSTTRRPTSLGRTAT